MSSRVWLRRAYEPPTRNDGYRVLVDRIWPRGASKEELQLDEWCRDIAPSDALRHWFDHDPSRWPEFCDHYRVELDENADVLARIVNRTKSGRVTLVYAARDREHNNAVALRDVIEGRRTES
jgi:uncharacterized protein YeaO (DUF488 family)